METGTETATFVNCFEVPAEGEDDFLATWREVNRYMRGQPGYIAHRLHRTVQPGSRFGFVNIAEWTSATSFRAARDAGFRAGVAPPVWADFPSMGTLCILVDEGNGRSGRGAYLAGAVPLHSPRSRWHVCATAPSVLLRPFGAGSPSGFVGSKGGGVG